MNASWESKHRRRMPNCFKGFLGNLQVQIAGGDDEHRRFGPEPFALRAIGEAVITDLEQGPEEHGPGLAQAGIPAQDQPVFE